jgi:peptidoglycan/xylan/chitin deacetylase (PgdA/CDA1 family)
MSVKWRILKLGILSCMPPFPWAALDAGHGHKIKCGGKASRLPAAWPCWNLVSFATASFVKNTLPSRICPLAREPFELSLDLRREEFLRTNQLVGRLSSAILFAALLQRAGVAQSPDSAKTVPPPVQLTAEQDHQRLMDLLHITSLRRGPDGDPKSPNAANTDESKVLPYTLPDPLVLKNGKKVTTADIWWKQRRPEIVEDFDREILGRMPSITPKVRWEVASSSNELQGGVPVITKRLVGHVDNSSYLQISVNMDLTLSTPANATGPVPVMIELSFSPEFMAMLAKRMPAPPEGAPPLDAWKNQLLAADWGYAVLIPTTIQADNGDGLTSGIIGLVNKGQPRKLDDWGALRAWAWGASRALDYLETENAVDSKHVGIEGLSRYGKAALVAMAYEPRFAIGFIASSGEGGAKILRRKFGEQVENVASTREYHWMAGNFLKYAGPLTPNDLPVDAHELIALCAPRPVFISSGSLQVEGGWIDGKGMFLGAVGAGPVYKLLGKKDLGTIEFPPMETPLIDGDIAFRQHSGGHTAAPNWPTFLTFASHYIHATPVPAATGSTASAASRASDSNGEVALTFDDLPAHGPLPPGMTRADIATSITRVLQAVHAPPVYGFINAKSLVEGPSAAQALQIWRDAGFPLGNHTFSHIDLDKNSIEAFEQDLLSNEAMLQKLMGQGDWRWLRFPYLHEGDTPEKHHAIEAFLKEHGYRVAEVTLSFGDYAYNEPYVRCLAKNDQQSIEWLKQSYMDGAAASLAIGQSTAKRLYGRDIKHVMLLHVGAFETVMFPRLLELLQQRGFRLITLQDAASDPAYAADPEPLTKWGGTFLQQVLASKNLSDDSNFDDSLAKVAAACQ